MIVVENKMQNKKNISRITGGRDLSICTLSSDGKYFNQYRDNGISNLYHYSSSVVGIFFYGYYNAIGFEGNTYKLPKGQIIRLYSDGEIAFNMDKK